MYLIKKYDPTKTYMSPNGGLATPEAVLKEFPAATTFTHIIETDEEEQTLFAIQNLAAMKSIAGIDKSVSDDEAIAILQEQRNAPAPEPEVTAEERIAAALEYNNIMNM